MKALLQMRKFILTAALVIASMTSPALAQDAVKKWQIVPEESSIAFAGKQYSGTFKGVFKGFTADITFDAEHLDQSIVSVVVDIATADTGDKERDTNIISSEWFDTPKFPSARFVSSSFTKTGENTFDMVGMLTLKETTLPLTIPFKLDITKDDSGKETAVAAGSIALDRSKFMLGTGEWKDPSIIGNEVAVNIAITATAIP